MLNLDGRVAVTGMGKSGHVARKVAATLASTGTPAYFIHPAEASHGDLGMISPRDAVIAYSNSGETVEMTSILTFCARHHIPVIGVTKNPASFLARQSAVPLILPDIPEACPIGCAPTTSTTMMMALGDAIALCLLRAKGFTPEDFHQYHPGGRLGRKLLTVRDIMHVGDEVPLVTPERLMGDVLLTITGKSFGSTGVIDAEGRLIGVITDGDLRRHMKPDFLLLTAGDIMTKNPVTIGPDILALQALGLMQKRAITTIFVVEDGSQPVGILHIHDCLRAGLE
ncbi:KpsF/GutQ family sugar-phosphate isomerase [Deltaproteobacteria bacterium Smac51]|nr:KpsF/GutQ family sugar-phosphate isomerase [Deltaproteobacteria bacterium Smac51]